MELRHAAASCPRGGAGIPALRPARARITTGLAAETSLAAVGAYGLTAQHLPLVAAGFGAAGAVVLAVALAFRWQTLIPWAVLLVGGGYLISREGRFGVDGWAAVVGVLLLLSAELATWSIEHDARIRTERALLGRRALTLALLAGAALLVNFILLGAAGLSGSPGVLVAAAGVAAAVTSVAVVLRLLRN